MEDSRSNPETPEELKAVLDAIDRPVFCISKDFKIERVNQKALNFLDLQNPAEARGESCFKLLYNRDAVCPFCPTNSEWRDQPPEPVDKIVQVRDQDTEKSFQLFINRVDLEDIYILETLEDITRKRQKQEEMLRMERLAAIGTMISGVAHELNNPLTGMELSLQNLVANVPTMDVQEVSRRLNMVRKDLHRAARIVNDILSFSRTEKTQLTRADIFTVANRARSTIIRLYPVLSRKVEWQIEEPRDSIFYFSPEKIERLFLNLFKNSIQALDYRAGYIHVELNKSGDWFEIIVADNAGGIPDDQLGKIFTPFYSNSKDGRGTGLGLSICHSIVEEHQGKIQVNSQGGATRFKISLPAYQDYHD